jgi:hypothetical protein
VINLSFHLGFERPCYLSTLNQKYLAFGSDVYHARSKKPGKLEQLFVSLHAVHLLLRCELLCLVDLYRLTDCMILHSMSDTFSSIVSFF